MAPSSPASSASILSIALYTSSSRPAEPLRSFKAFASLASHDELSLMSMFCASESSFSSYFLQQSRRTSLPSLFQSRPPPHELYQRRLGHSRSQARREVHEIKEDALSEAQLEERLLRALVSAGHSKHRTRTHADASATSMTTINNSRHRMASAYLSQRRTYAAFALKAAETDNEATDDQSEQQSTSSTGYANTTLKDVRHTYQPAAAPITLDEYYNMMDKCFLRPKVQPFPETVANPLEAIGAEEQHSAVDVDVSTTQNFSAREGTLLHSALRARVRERASMDKVGALVQMVKADYNEIPHEDIFNAYLAIPEPRLLYIPEKARQRLLGHFSIVRWKSEASLLRFMTLVDDHHSAGIKLGVREWSTAISLTAKAFKKISSESVNSALQVWRQMEAEQGIPANTVTFNILFDMASKAGKYTLAETLVREMKHRELSFDAFSHTSKIYYEGIRGSIEGVHAAYDALVEAGEVVNTVVISAVIAALLKCGEPAAAESVFDRAKRLHKEKYKGPRPLPATTWTERRKQGRMFLPKAKEPVRSPIAPGYHAYRSLVHYHAVSAGNVDRALALVDEMVSLYRIPVSASIYISLFRGFELHGGTPYSSWTSQSLESVFVFLLKNLEESAQKVRQSSNPTTSSQASDEAQDADGFYGAFRPIHETPEESLFPSETNAPKGTDREDAFVLGNSLFLLCIRAFLKCASLGRANEVYHALRSHSSSTEVLQAQIDDLFNAEKPKKDERRERFHGAEPAT
ncbi:hypothetical protein FH972_025909 [Carpinus fangiana]|uniref:Pentacotripeptide-repeat region of PRORP domain-containing protein n=1 Tax=Carpinus fangiana TaxID=176857 RepID=A0A5N6L2Y0_9ROSI|nr:hypothetical protein FH972_025909 [Carpinus fangiana]